MFTVFSRTTMCTYYTITSNIWQAKMSSKRLRFSIEYIWNLKNILEWNNSYTWATIRVVFVIRILIGCTYYDRNLQNSFVDRSKILKWLTFYYCILIHKNRGVPYFLFCLETTNINTLQVCFTFLCLLFRYAKILFLSVQ